jgi:hypothetical protein
MNKAGFTIGVAGICLVMCVIMNERMLTISKNVDDLHEAGLAMDATLYTSVVTNMTTTHGEIGFLLNTIEEAEARLAKLTADMGRFAKVSQYQTAFIHDAIQEEMGFKDLKKFKKEWNDAQVQK